LRPLFRDVETDIVKPYLVGPGGLLDDNAHAYGADALVLVRPDGHIGLVADAADTATVAEYLRCLSETSKAPGSAKARARSSARADD
jgi:hypothetical protein